jgi:dolichol-phosphate mannosyltransferase
MDKILKNTFKIESFVLRQFIVYGFIALIPTVVDFLLLYFLTEILGIFYMVSLIAAFVLSSVVSYISHKKITFRNESQRYIVQFSNFFLISLGGLAINMGVVFGLVEFFGLWYIFAKVVAATITYFWSFTINRQVTFKKFQ